MRNPDSKPTCFTARCRSSVTVLTPWQRIEEIIEGYEFENLGELTRYLGLPEGHLYRIKQTREIDRDTALAIFTKLPYVCKKWLRYGVGEMLCPEYWP